MRFYRLPVSASQRQCVFSSTSSSLALIGHCASTQDLFLVDVSLATESEAQLVGRAWDMTSASTEWAISVDPDVIERHLASH